MRVLCLNQFVPPDAAPTAKLLGDLRQSLEMHGWEVSLTGLHGSYRGRKSRGWRRWLREGCAHLALLGRGLFAPRPDIVLCLTDPPLLPVTAAVLARLRGAKLVHWAMDVYPEVAAALGVLKTSSRLYRWVHALARWAYADCAAIVCLDADMAGMIGGSDSSRSVLCPPWADVALPLPDAVPPPGDDTIRWLYSGNLGRAHEYETLLRAQRLLEDQNAPFELVFQGGGASREAAQSLATELGLTRCVWKNYAADEHLVSTLLDAHVLVATQRPETRGLLWPSKLALLMALPRPIVWAGPVEGAVATQLRGLPQHTGMFAPGDAPGLARWLLDHAEEFRRVRRAPFQAAEVKKNLDNAREAGVECWHRLLASLLPAA